VALLLELGQFAGPKGIFDTTYPGLRKWAQSDDGGVYGIVVDCNPNVIWFNRSSSALPASARILRLPSRREHGTRLH
jgi:hypothetical protein